MKKKKQESTSDPYHDREAQRYENPIPSREFILDYLEKEGRPLTYKHLVQALKLEKSEEQEALRRRLLAMRRDGQLLQDRRDAFGVASKMQLIAGRVMGHRDGFGFVVPDDGNDDLFLNARHMRAVFHNDRVLVRVTNPDVRGRREAALVEVLEHNTKNLVGRFFAESGITFVQPSHQRITQDVFIPPDAVSHAKPGQMVVVEITSQPTLYARPTGKIVEVLGDHMAPGMEIDVAIRNHDLPHEWSDALIEAASRFSAHVPEDALKNRLDLRQHPFVTIDGEDAKDFDDAVYCEPQKNGGWLLYVAIADVSHYVTPDTPLDEEALNRGNSVYFPGHVIPMLPEVLSNGLCSLNPKVDRLTMVCKMTINALGKILRYDFYEGVIHSHARLTYTQVHQMIVEKQEDLRKSFHALLPQLEELFKIYHVLHTARAKRGAIDFDLPETKIIFGPDRKIERIVPLQRNDAHRLIEECMLAANICAASFLDKNNCPALFRVHEGPSVEKLEDLRRFLGELGLKLPGRKEPTPRDYASLLESIATRPDASLIQTVLLRSLSQAIYSPENKGHFGLAYEAYAHFTSPIRRYPDLLVHRTIKNILNHKKHPGEKTSRLEKYGEHCSMTERRADDATREAVDWLKCEYMQDKVGEEFAGLISSVTHFGFFVALKNVYVEGLVHISLLPSDYYQYNAIKHSLYGERSGRRFRLGDEVLIKVARVDLDERKIDFILAEKRVPKKKKN